MGQRGPVCQEATEIVVCTSISGSIDQSHACLLSSSRAVVGYMPWNDSLCSSWPSENQDAKKRSIVRKLDRYTQETNSMR